MNAQPAGPLARRIAARRGQPVPEQPERRLVAATAPVVRPPWLERLTARDNTREVLS